MLLFEEAFHVQEIRVCSSIRYRSDRIRIHGEDEFAVAGILEGKITFRVVHLSILNGQFHNAFSRVFSGKYHYFLDHTFQTTHENDRLTFQIHGCIAIHTDVQTHRGTARWRRKISIDICEEVLALIRKDLYKRNGFIGLNITDLNGLRKRVKKG